MSGDYVIVIDDPEKSADGGGTVQPHQGGRNGGERFEVHDWSSHPDDGYATLYSRELDPCGGVGSLDSKSTASRRPNGSLFGLNAIWSRLRQSLSVQIPGVYILGLVVAIVCGIIMLPWRRGRRRRRAGPTTTGRPTAPRPTKPTRVGSLDQGSKRVVSKGKKNV